MEQIESKFWRDRSVFVTGATGLFGSTLTQALVERGAHVVALVRDQVSGSNFYRLELDKEVDIVRGEIENYALLERILNEYEVDTVYHLAAQTIVGVANASPLSTFEANIKGTWNLMEACRRTPRVKRIVVSTSDKAYGAQPKLPYDEGMPLQGRHPYDVSKSCADLICQSFAESFELPVCVIRCANLFGAGDLNFNRLIPGTIRSLYYDERPVIRSDGKFIRDYLYVGDAVRGAILIAEMFEKKKLGGEVFNLGMGLQESALSIVSRLTRLMRSKQNPVVLNQANNEIRQQYLSSKKIGRVLGWKPAAPFDRALYETIGWYSDYLARA